MDPPKKFKVEKFQNGPVLKKYHILFSTILHNFVYQVTLIIQVGIINEQPLIDYPNGDGIFVQDGANAHTSNLVPQYLHGFVNK